MASWSLRLLCRAAVRLKETAPINNVGQPGYSSYTRTYIL